MATTREELEQAARAARNYESADALFYVNRALEALTLDEAKVAAHGPMKEALEAMKRWQDYVRDVDNYEARMGGFLLRTACDLTDAALALAQKVGTP